MTYCYSNVTYTVPYFWRKKIFLISIFPLVVVQRGEENVTVERRVTYPGKEDEEKKVFNEIFACQTFSPFSCLSPQIFYGSLLAFLALYAREDSKVSPSLSSIEAVYVCDRELSSFLLAKNSNLLSTEKCHWSVILSCWLSLRACFFNPPGRKP